MTDPTSDRAFSVHARHLDRHAARLVLESSFEAAAVAYVEDLFELAGARGEISLLVRELSSGHEHCFHIDLETGEAAPCD